MTELDFQSGAVSRVIPLKPGGSAESHHQVYNWPVVCTLNYLAKYGAQEGLWSRELPPFPRYNEEKYIIWLFCLFRR